MMKKLLVCCMLLPGLCSAACGCSPEEAPARKTEQPERPDAAPDESPEGDDPVRPAAVTFTLRIGEVTFACMPADNAAARAFAARLPLTAEMGELNGNEKFAYLDASLPTAASRPGTMRAGDLMLYGSDCLVLFYRTFDSAYGYTPLGRIADPSELTRVVGSGAVRVTFERSKNTE